MSIFYSHYMSKFYSLFCVTMGASFYSTFCVNFTQDFLQCKMLTFDFIFALMFMRQIMKTKLLTMEM